MKMLRLSDLNTLSSRHIYSHLFPRHLTYPNKFNISFIAINGIHVDYRT